MMPNQSSKSSKINYKLNQKSEHPYNFTLFYKEDDLTFYFEDTKDFPIKFFELKTSMKELKQLDENLKCLKLKI